MILNSGLDSACTTNASNDNSSPDRRPYFSAWVTYAAFGTGSAAPDATDTSLGSQVGARSNSDGGFAESDDGGLDSSNNLIWYEGTYTRVFSINSNVNATEWGLAPASTGNLSVRELFRADPLDNSSSPITLTLEAGDELQLVITVRVQAEWEYASKSFTITGAPGNDAAGTYDGHATITPGATGSVLNIRQSLIAAWPGGDNTFVGLAVITSDQSSKTKAQDLSNPASVKVAAAAGYTPGTYYRDYSTTWTTSEANGTHYAWVATSGTGGTDSRGYRFILDDPTSLTKASTHKLTLTVRKSIARL